MTPLLLTPGPLTTAPATRAAMAQDWGSRDPGFTALSDSLRTRLPALAGVAATHEAIPLQGSGTFAVEAGITTLVPPGGHLLVVANGAYGQRIAAIGRRAGRRVTVLESPEEQPTPLAPLAEALADPTVTDVAVVHCETTSGVLNPLAEAAALVRDAGRRLFVDAMSSFGAIPLGDVPFTALAASSNKGLEGAPGLGFVLAERGHLATCAGHASTLSLDLHDQWRGFLANGQWRFTPPVQVVAALATALDLLEAEGGVPARHARYCANRDALVAGMRAHGFTPLVAPAHQAPVIVTFAIPGGWFDFARFYAFLAERGIVIYPGKLTQQPSFRIGCIGAIGPADIARALDAVAAFMRAHAPAYAA